jgi:hypothetical protein
MLLLENLISKAVLVVPPGQELSDVQNLSQ